MSIVRPSNADNEGPTAKRTKMDTEDEFPYDARITVLMSFGKAVSSVHAGEFAKISRDNTGNHRISPYSGGASVQSHDFQVEKTLVRFLAHWIYHRDAKEAINASFHRQNKAQPGQVDEEWLIFLLKAMNFCNDGWKFTCDITDSLVDAFLSFVASKSGMVHLDQIFTIFKEHCKTGALTHIFANLFLHHRKQFVKQIPTCYFEQVIQRHMHDMLGDILVNDGDFKKLPHDLSVPGYHPCDHHAHGDNNTCYVWGRVMNPGWR
ncbi:hypothetical protein KCU92_g4583, partial [Aureobasidium melanogenum]